MLEDVLAGGLVDKYAVGSLLGMWVPIVTAIQPARRFTYAAHTSRNTVHMWRT